MFPSLSQKLIVARLFRLFHSSVHPPNDTIYHYTFNCPQRQNLRNIFCRGKYIVKCQLCHRAPHTLIIIIFHSSRENKHQLAWNIFIYLLASSQHAQSHLAPNTHLMYFHIVHSLQRKRDPDVSCRGIFSNVHRRPRSQHGRPITYYCHIFPFPLSAKKARVGCRGIGSNVYWPRDSQHGVTAHTNVTSLPSSFLAVVCSENNHQLPWSRFKCLLASSQHDVTAQQTYTT